MENFRLAVFKKASLCRNFEQYVYDGIKRGLFRFPIYLSAGQEYVSATIAQVVQDKDIKPNIFIQHRGHSTYLAHNAPIEKLVDELLGRKTGCARGMGGSASIHSVEQNIFGHDGLMGSQAPIAVGHCYSTRTPTIVHLGDASTEEDYALGAMGWASTKNLPILFVIEDNNLSILTEKKVRRSWDISNVARAFNMEAHNTTDDPIEFEAYLQKAFEKPMLLNVSTHRKYWHSGAGCDDENTFDRYTFEMSNLGTKAIEIDRFYKEKVDEVWRKQLEKQ